MRSFGRAARIRLLLTLAPFALAVGCGLSGAVDDVVQSPNDPSTVASGSGSSSTAGSGGSGSSSTTGANVGGGTTGPEDCTDGIDNDGDGLTDCGDSDCSPDFECVEEPPGAAGGLYRVDQSSIGAGVQCADGSKPEGYFGDPGGPPECAFCTCTDPAGASCSQPSISCSAGSTDCSFFVTDWTAAASMNACNKPNLLGGSNQLSCMLTSASVPSGKATCQPGVSDFPNKDMFGSEVAACPVPKSGSGGCGDTQACIPKAPAGSPQSVCIKLDGAQKCPTGFTTVIPAFTGGTDTRACAACQCGDPTLGCTGGGFTFYDLNACAAGGDNPVTVSSNMCLNLSALLDQQSWSVAPSAPQLTGTCPVSGGAPSGSVQTNGPVTFCCQ